MTKKNLAFSFVLWQNLIRWEARLDSIAVRLGLTGNICLAFLFYPVARGSSLLAAIGLTSESSMKYHIWLGHLVMTLFTCHGLFYVIYWISTNQISQVSLSMSGTEIMSRFDHFGLILLLSPLIVGVNRCSSGIGPESRI